MNQAWVHLFAKFTDELLLFQALSIFLVGAGYAAYWLLKRRKDMLNQAVPANIVKSYLGSLIADAESLRAQLFGIMQQIGGVDGSHKMPMTGASDPALFERMSTLEKQAHDQAAAMQAMLAEKERLSKELEAARAAGASGAAPAAPAGDNSDLLSRIASLEAKLAEYSIIEDDLANLKRLQQENSQLRNQLAGIDKGAPAPSAQQTGATAAAAPTPAPTAAPVAEAAPAASAPLSTGTFEATVDKIEQNLEAAPAAPPVADAAPAAPEGEKSDADLVAEFEKMLNS